MAITKYTAWPFYAMMFGYKLRYAGDTDTKKYDRCKDACIIISNHTHIFDMLTVEHVFYRREVRTLTAEVMYNKNPLFAWFLKTRGHIRVERGTKDMSAINETRETLKNGGAVLLFAESRLEKNGEGLLPFKPGAVLFSLQTGAPVLPMYFITHFRPFKPVLVIMGEPINMAEYFDFSKPEKEALAEALAYLREEVLNLKKIYDSEVGKKNKNGV